MAEQFKGVDTVDFTEGDWVRFYRNGVLVVGEVRYMHRDITDKLKLSTDQGEIDSRAVIEIRRLAEYIKGDD